MTTDPRDLHPSDEELLCAADGELSTKRSAEVRAHLVACWSCRARQGELERAIADFVRLREHVGSMPPPGPGRALLRARMAELADSVPPSRGPGSWLTRHLGRVLLLASALMALFALGVFFFPRTAPNRFRLSAANIDSRAMPDPRLTPGATLPVSRDDICTEGAVEAARLVPPAVAQAVFAAYGIRRPEPRAYELDYLVAPALGGADNIRNFWPQSYRETIWNAHIKDALEDHLHRLVCTDELDLAEAQQEISRNWIAAYRKYFHTNDPLPEHQAFLKDRPWE